LIIPHETPSFVVIQPVNQPRSIVDVHSHAWQQDRHFTQDFRDQTRRARAGVEVDLTVRYADYRATASVETTTVVFGGKARLSGVWVEDEFVAAYVAKDPARLVGFLALDPTQAGWEEELVQGHQQLGLRGIKLMPMYAGFRPDEKRLDPLWEYATEHRLPVLLHTGTTFISQAPLDCTLPRHLDEVAIRFPEVRIILAHLGHPYEPECVATIRKHPNLYADVSALHYRPFQLYHSLMLVQEYGVWDKILFGTDYPFTTVDASMAGLRGLNQITTGTGLPRLNEEAIEDMIYRDSLEILGLRTKGAST
jgi:predicted TIM-barrel fold metal-dependent hydrolase